MGETLFTSASLLDFLLQVDELEDLDISVTDTPTSVDIKIGDSIYQISKESDEELEVEVDDNTLYEVEEMKLDAFEEIQDANTSYESIESGIIKEFAKTLLVGGLVRLTNKLLKK